MTPAEFKTKWAKVSAKESAAYQSHFDDLCRMLKLAPPLEADPKGETFCYQKRVVKDAELFDLGDADDGDAPRQRGFADVWKKDCFAWEYKGQKKNLDEAYNQLLRYRESLLNPPLLVVCDFNRFIIKTNFNGTVQEIHEFTNAQIDDPKNLRLLRSLFTEPDFLKPQRTTAEVTEKLARQIAEVAKSLQHRKSRELADAKTRAEASYSQRKNLRIARFLNRVVFCFFAEDTGLLPKGLFSEITRTAADDAAHFAETLENLFAVMATGGTFGVHKIRHFNGHLFEDSTVFELTDGELAKLAEAGESDWQFIQPSIMGTLFERALDDSQRSQLGAHYTSEEDIKTLVEPVLMAPLRREWSALKGQLAAACVKGKGTPAQRDQLTHFQKTLSATTVLDPACGSGNFLYVSLQLLLGLEKEVVTCGAQLGFKLALRVSVQQLRALEINPYAFELAQVAVQIGFLQWRRENGFDNDRTPVLESLAGFQNKDALMRDVFKAVPRNLQEAQAEEHGAVVPLGGSQVEIAGTRAQDEFTEVAASPSKAGKDRVRAYYERAWPACDVIVGNPPFLGDKFMRGELGDHYVVELRKIFGERIPGQSDLCCYWFEKARQQIEDGKCKRAGLLATQGIRGGANREVLKRIKATGGIFFAESDRDWVLGGATVHVSMIGFDNRAEATHTLDGRAVAMINANLTSNLDLTSAKSLSANSDCSFQGPVRVGDFDVSEKEATDWLHAPNPNRHPNSDVIRPTLNGGDNVKRSRGRWVIDFDKRPDDEAALYELPFERVLKCVKPLRDQSNDAQRRKSWWLHGRTGNEIRSAVASRSRFVALAQTAKFILFRWHDTITSPEQTLIVFARDDDYFFGVLHSRIHALWALGTGTQLREKESGFRYTPTTCFETFPFPFADDTTQDALRIVAGFRAAHYHTDQNDLLREDPPPSSRAEHRNAIAAAAKELNALRENWLNPPEWTATRTLEFPARADGPWARFIETGKRRPETGKDECDAAVSHLSGLRSPVSGFGLARYPLTEPRDAACAAKLKKRTLTNLYNERPAWLANAHAKLDAAVAAAYDWPADLSDDEILSRLLALNLARAAEEAKADGGKKPRTTRQKAADEML